MSEHDDLFYLEGMAEHIQAIKNYLPADKAQFVTDPKSIDAVLMRLLALGEEISRLSDDFKQKYPELPWYKIIGLRNRLAHDYFVVDSEVVWEIVHGGPLEELNRAIERMLK